MSRRKRQLRTEALEARQLLTSMLGEVAPAPVAWETTAWVSGAAVSSEDLLTYLDVQLCDVTAQHDVSAVQVPWTREFCSQVDGFMAQVTTWENGGSPEGMDAAEGGNV